MKNNAKDTAGTEINKPSHMPKNSFFEKVIPATLIIMGIVTVGLILFSIAVIFGWIAF